ncbi:MAG: GDP-mannose pyrophosphatase [Bacteroidetes bacterium]|nr:MAG: GDP-mannose pyrophosphatase [Bacteroidota bacterium]PTM10013.1 MAG: GDP-mannose pyrophosphatase [Bacteroidota bacterium]
MIRNHRTEVLSDHWYTLRKHTFELRLRSGEWATQTREAYDRGNGAGILLYNKAEGKVLLTRQFRLPTFVNGNPDGMMIEVCAGLLDEADPADCIRRETEEETGYRIQEVKKVLEAYMSPGAVTEILYLFVGEYHAHQKVSEGGGLEEETEDIEVLECTLDEALAMVKNGTIRDAKTIMLLQYAKLEGLV